MISPEFEILKLCVRLDDRDSAIEKAAGIIKSNRVNWADLYDRADLHSVKP
jgi:hypothetical protein